MNHIRQCLLPKRHACPPRAGSPPLELRLSAGDRSSTPGVGKEQDNEPGRGRTQHTEEPCRAPGPFLWLHPTSIRNLSCSPASNQLQQLFFGHVSPLLSGDHHKAPFQNHPCLYPTRTSRAPLCSWHRGPPLPQPTNLLCSSEMSLPECQRGLT